MALSFSWLHQTPAMMLIFLLLRRTTSSSYARSLCVYCIAFTQMSQIKCGSIRSRPRSRNCTESFRDLRIRPSLSALTRFVDSRAALRTLTEADAIALRDLPNLYMRRNRYVMRPERAYFNLATLGTGTHPTCGNSNYDTLAPDATFSLELDQIKARGMGDSRVIESG